MYKTILTGVISGALMLTGCTGVTDSGHPVGQESGLRAVSGGNTDKTGTVASERVLFTQDFATYYLPDINGTNSFSANGATYSSSTNQFFIYGTTWMAPKDGEKLGVVGAPGQSSYTYGTVTIEFDSPTDEVAFDLLDFIANSSTASPTAFKIDLYGPNQLRESVTLTGTEVNAFSGHKEYRAHYTYSKNAVSKVAISYADLLYPYGWNEIYLDNLTYHKNASN